MASNYLELKSEIENSGAAFLTPTSNLGCGITTTFDQSNEIDIDGLDISSITNALAETQAAIDAFGSDVMEVLIDIGAWIPPLSSLSQQTPGGTTSSTVADIDDDTATVNSHAADDSSTVRGSNQQGDSYCGTTWGDESHWAKDTDGSFVFSAAKAPKNNHKGGAFWVNSAGPTVFKVGEALVIDVRNMNNVNSGTDPIESGTTTSDQTRGTAFSLYVIGNVRIENTGDMSVKSEGNLSISAGKTLTLKSAEKVEILAGAGPKTGSGTTDKSYGGTVSIKTGKFEVDKSGEQTLVESEYKKINGEVVFAMTNPAGNFGITSAGSMEVKVTGDMYEIIGGRKKTEVMANMGATVPALGDSLLAGQQSGYVITTGPVFKPVGVGVPTHAEGLPGVEGTIYPVLSINSGTKIQNPLVGGLRVRAVAGDIDLSTLSGNVLMHSELGILGSILKKAPIDKYAPKATALTAKLPGVYVGSRATRVDVFSTVQTVMSVTPSGAPMPKPVDKAIDINAVTLEIKNISGIYLN